MTTFIKYGIDLGTTNSSIARLNNSQVQVIKDLDFNSEVVTFLCRSHTQTNGGW